MTTGQAVIDASTGFERASVDFNLPFGGAEAPVCVSSVGGSAFEAYIDLAFANTVWSSDIRVRVYALIAGQERLVYERMIRQGEIGAVARVATRADGFRVTVRPLAQVQPYSAPLDKPRTAGRITYAVYGWEPPSWRASDIGLVPPSPPSFSSGLGWGNAASAGGLVMPGPIHLRQLSFTLEADAATWVWLTDGANTSPGTNTVFGKKYVSKLGDSVDWDFRDTHTGTNDGYVLRQGLAIQFTATPTWANAASLVSRQYSLQYEYRGTSRFVGPGYPQSGFY